MKQQRLDCLTDICVNSNMVEKGCQRREISKGERVFCTHAHCWRSCGSEWGLMWTTLPCRTLDVTLDLKDPQYPEHDLGSLELAVTLSPREGEMRDAVRELHHSDYSVIFPLLRIQELFPWASFLHNSSTPMTYILAKCNLMNQTSQSRFYIILKSSGTMLSNLSELNWKCFNSANTHTLTQV